MRNHGGHFAGLAAGLPGHRVLAPDLLGHGHSPWEPPWDIGAHLAAIVETVGARESVLVGHSFGGRLAFELAARAPKLVPKLVLLDPAILLPGHVALAAAENAREEKAYVSFDDLIERRFDESQLHFARRGARRRGPRAARRDAGDDGRLRYRYCQSAVVAAYGEMASRPPRFEDVRVPTLLVLGERSYLPYDHLLDAHRAALGDLLEVVVVPGGHSVLWDALDETAAAIAAFLAALGAELGRDGDVGLDAALERPDVDPLDLGVRSLPERAEEHGRHPRGGEQRGVRPERHADELGLGSEDARQRPDDAHELARLVDLERLARGDHVNVPPEVRVARAGPLEDLAQLASTSSTVSPGIVRRSAWTTQ